MQAVLFISSACHQKVIEDQNEHLINGLSVLRGIKEHLISQNMTIQQ